MEKLSLRRSIQLLPGIPDLMRPHSRLAKRGVWPAGPPAAQAAVHGTAVLPRAAARGAKRR